MIRNYFAFIDIRYNREIVWDIAVENGLEHAMVLSLMIQPVVENAIIHGIKPRGTGHVQIIAESNNAELVIRIMDDGVGMDQDTLTGLTRQLNDTEFDDKDSDAPEGGRYPMGLKNVHDRLRYEYADPYGLSINSAPQIGTSVTMLLPLIFEEKDV
jgi:two-component system sensor histidine kinase YesM